MFKIVQVVGGLIVMMLFAFGIARTLKAAYDDRLRNPPATPSPTPMMTVRCILDSDQVARFK